MQLPETIRMPQDGDLVVETVWDAARLEADRRARRALQACGSPPPPPRSQRVLRMVGASFSKVLELALVVAAWAVWTYALLRFALA